MSLAMAGTFPGVFIFQFVAAPFALAILLVAWLVCWRTELNASTATEDPLVIGMSVAVILLNLFMIGGMSLLGFYEGWRAGWQISKGRRWRDAIAQGPSARMIRFLRARLHGAVRETR